MNATVPASGWIRQTTIQDIFAVMVLFSIMCGFCELLSSSIILRFQGQECPYWTPKPGLLRFQIFLLLMPEAVLMFFVMNGRENLRTPLHLRIYIHSLFSVSWCFFLWVNPEWLEPMGAVMMILLSVHFVFSVALFFYAKRMSVYDILPYQVLVMQLLHLNLWEQPALSPFIGHVCF